ncbi:hypothetical protein Tco_0989057 [Tanacetum coccineum]|uniref:Retroviral polymerase SH3-like domain-containing protein n=1 Tax=Tanacetum coccineum TaxID=301880 RepID=A0ABQ5ETA0_9ASTR
MSTQQDIYVAGSETCPPTLNKENYVPWSSRLLRYAKSRPNGKLIYNSIMNGPYVRRMILNQIAQPSMNMGQDRQMQMVRGNGGNQFRQYAGQNVGNQNGYNAVHNVRNQNPNGNGNVVAARAEGNAKGNNEAGIQLQAEEFDLMAAARDLDEIEEVNANCILMANLQQASTSGTQTDKAPVYNSDGSTENDINVISEVSSVEQYGGTIEQHPATIEETCAYFELLYNNLAIEVEKVNMVNHKLRETNADLTIELNDREDIGKLGAKGDIGFFIGYSATSCAYRVYNRRTKKIIETMNVTFDELSAMAFEQRSIKPGLQSMTSGQISSGLDLTYAPSTITTQQLTKRELDLLFEAIYDDYVSGPHR